MDDLELLCRCRSGCTIRSHEGEHALDFARGHHLLITDPGIQRKHAVPLGRATEWSGDWPATGDPNGDTRMLHWAGRELRGPNVVVGSLKREGFSAPRAGENAQALLQHRRAHLRVAR